MTSIKALKEAAEKAERPWEVYQAKLKELKAGLKRE